MSVVEPPGRIKWYRSPVCREDLSRLNRRSDFKGFAQTLGYLAILATTASASVWSARHWSWMATAGLLFLHGTCWAFMINGFHELVHDSVFRTRWLNGAFLRLFSFLGWYNHHLFWASHTEHHKYTLHQPDDLEVTLPIPITLKGFLTSAFINPRGLWWTIKGQVRLARGQLKGPWEHHLYDNAEPAVRRRLFNWARIVLAGHLAIAVISIAMEWWMVPVVISLASFYGGAIQFLCNNSQHIGLKDNVPDYRLCCRTIYLNPAFQFLYWHMNYHTEHHMYAAVPCYNLGRLYRLIRDDMPPTPHGLYQTWKQIAAILRRQKEDPSYQYEMELPEGSGQAQ